MRNALNGGLWPPFCYKITAVLQDLACAHASCGAGLCGSWLACDSIAAVYLPDRGVCIAGKPAPT
ncbi:hypothetical protein BFW87_17920 [Pseudomonas fluorescens]|uniref:Uncharacterized protein n=1 Tax=Pseudomonas fluorescens TaxID=294 RepID=A0A1T2YK06_PSEFL|nr:hypothetical protein BFW87_17920 [Pseudomonas fluorescens]